MKVLVTGATGFIGKKILSRFPGGVALSRNASKAKEALGNDVSVYEWDPMKEPAPLAAFEGVDAVFNLMGESVAEGRWNAEKKRRILESRVVGTRHLVEGLARLSNRPRVLVSASAIGYYGDRGNEVLNEDSKAAADFLADVCKKWEAEAHAAEKLGMRVVIIRVGLVLGKDGGALPKMLLPFKFGVGGKLGKGDQWMSWIHVEDLVSLFQEAALNDTYRGDFNGVAPFPVTNAEFTKALGSALKRPTVFPVPPLALKLAVGEFSKVLLASQRVIPSGAEKHQFPFKHVKVEPALRDLLA